ncbi:TetR/AcrR family transcriptional regulator [Streptomyces sp. NPDC058676]|uniref:TetR/AcrR family transcriptional regulator n=1 Tax=unclassified Streptomyces TaxID=2593676 RepID=UPI003653CBAA
MDDALLYRYFGSKLDLFDTVYSRLVTDTVDAVPLDATDLPGYVGRLYDHYADHPHIVRLTVWHQLERPDQPLPDAVGAATKKKIDNIAAAQKAGVLPPTLPPGEVLALITHLSLINTPLGSAAEGAVDRDRRRALAVETTRSALAV